MTAGFGHFDACEQENFCSALLLLCCDEDAAFRDAFSALVRGVTSLPASSPLTDWSREEVMGVDGSSRRCDLRLDFAEHTVLIEVKTHGRWSWDGVVQQVQDQRRATLGVREIAAVVLLAPESIIRGIGAGDDFASVSWAQLLHLARQITNPTRFLVLAIEQWSRSVKRTFGIHPSTASPDAVDIICGAGCLAEFLVDILNRIGTARRGEVLFSSGDGSPRSAKGWSWHGIRVPGRIAGERVYLGIYTYVAAPESAAAGLGSWLELYKVGDDDVPLHSSRFGPPNLSHDELAPLGDEFVAGYASKF